MSEDRLDLQALRAQLYDAMKDTQVWGTCDPSAAGRGPRAEAPAVHLQRAVDFSSSAAPSASSYSTRSARSQCCRHGLAQRRLQGSEAEFARAGS